MAYDIPPDIRYREKIVMGLDWRQFLYLLGSGIISLVVYSSDISQGVRDYLSISVVGLGIGMAFFGLDRTILLACRYAKAKLDIWRASDVVYEFLGIDEIKNDSIVMSDSSLVAIVEVDGFSFSLMNDDQREEVIEGAREVFNSLNFETQWIVRSVKLDMEAHFDRLEKLNPDEEERIRDQKNYWLKYLKENNVMDKKCYVIVPLRGTRPLTNVSLPWIGKPGIDEDFETLSKRVTTLMERLKDMNLNPRRLDDDGLVNLLLSYFNYEPDGSEEYLSDYVKLSKTRLNYDGMEINSKIIKVIAAVGYPDAISPGWIEKLLATPGDFDFVIHDTPLTNAESIRLNNTQIKKLETDILSFENKGLSVPVPLQLKLNSCKRLLEAVMSGEEKLSLFSMYVLASAYTKKGIDRLTDSIYSRFKSVGIEPSIVTLDVKKAILSVLPLGIDHLKGNRIMPSRPRSACFPFRVSSTNMGGEPIIVGINLETGLPVMIDYSTLMNGNVCVMGMAGSGKSVSVKDWIYQLRFYPNRSIYVLDREGEYVELAKKLGGQVIHIAPDSDTSINPLDMFDMDLVSKKASIILFFKSLFEVTSAQETLLYPILDEVYSAKGITDDPATWEREEPLLEDVHRLIQNRTYEKKVDPDERRTVNAFSRKLGPFVQGNMRSIFNKHTNANLNERFVVFDTSRTPKLMIDAVMYTLLEFLVNKMAKKKRRNSEEIRRDILKFLEGQTFPRTTGQIAREVGLNWYSTSHHLALMRAEGLLFHEKVGRQNQWWPENIDRLTKENRKLRKENKKIPELEDKIKRLEEKIIRLEKK